MRAQFESNEQVELRLLWRDPLHDFAFLSFDPKQIKDQELCAIKLRPDLLAEGVEVRIVGNSAGVGKQVGYA